MKIILNKNLLSLILHWFKPSFISIFTYDEFIVKKKNHKTQTQKKVWLASVSKLHVMFQSQTAQPKNCSCSHYYYTVFHQTVYMRHNLWR